jgi:hypothetical protein
MVRQISMPTNAQGCFVRDRARLFRAIQTDRQQSRDSKRLVDTHGVRCSERQGAHWKSLLETVDDGSLLVNCVAIMQFVNCAWAEEI